MAQVIWILARTDYIDYGVGFFRGSKRPIGGKKKKGNEE
jgi:hypothetical protein